MLRLSSRFIRTKVSPVKDLFTKTSSSCSFTAFTVNPTIQKQREKAIPCDFLKWSSLGLYRTSRFATGFTPLQPKPLDSIIDIERAKDKSAEDLATIWDDVCTISGTSAFFFFCEQFFWVHIINGLCYFSIIWEGVTFARPWKPSFIVYWSTDQLIGNLLIILLCICLHSPCSAFLFSIALYSRYFVIPLWKGSGYATMFVQGLLSDESRISYMLLFSEIWSSSIFKKKKKFLSWYIDWPFWCTNSRVLGVLLLNKWKEEITLASR